jgi:hypothetical protein
LNKILIPLFILGKYRYTRDWHTVDCARFVFIPIPAFDGSVIYSTGRRHARRKFIGVCVMDYEGSTNNKNKYLRRKK